MQHRRLVKPQSPMFEKNGWSLFTPEFSWFVYDFFKYKLSPYEKLIFFGYYVMGFTLEELAERLHCTFQNIAIRIKKINAEMKHCWESKEEWRPPDDGE